MTDERIPVHILATRIIANVSQELAGRLGLRPHQRSIGVVTTDCDDATYLALDEATKKASVEVVYAKSMYAGAGCASTSLAGEVIGVLAGSSPEEVSAGLRGAIQVLEEVGFRKGDEEGRVVYFAQTVSRAGSYLSALTGVAEGQALAYLVAPPLESVVGLDRALKAADVTLCTFFSPPSETNFGGGVLTGSRSACEAACQAFGTAVKEVAARPREE